MVYSHEDIVTKLLSSSEILQTDRLGRNKLSCTNPIYDLTLFLQTSEAEPSRFGEKYIFVK